MNTITRLGYRLRYYFKTACKFVGICPKCASSLNYTMADRAICPNC